MKDHNKYLTEESKRITKEIQEKFDKLKKEIELEYKVHLTASYDFAYDIVDSEYQDIGIVV